MLYQETEHDKKATLTVISGMLFRKNGKNQKKQSVQLFCLKNQWISHSSTFNLGIPMEFRWKMKLLGLFYQLATLVNKIKSLKFHFPTQFHGNTKISSGKWEIHWFFDKIIEQSTISIEEKVLDFSFVRNFERYW